MVWALIHGGTWNCPSRELIEELLSVVVKDDGRRNCEGKAGLLRPRWPCGSKPRPVLKAYTQALPEKESIIHHQPAPRQIGAR